MLPKSFKAGKCKTSLKLAVARIRLLKNKRQAQVKHMRRELAQLLESGQEQTARIRVEHVIREEKTMAAYDLIELYCELIVARLPIIESQKSCPIDLREAISSVIFASPRCADLPELMDIRKHFVAKYGKEFVNSALEVRPDCRVNHMVIEKLSARAPDVETKIKILTAIAQEHNVKWDSKSFEEQLQKPNDDLLNGPNTFANASKMPMESSNIKSSPAPTQTNESSMKMSQNDAASIPTSYSTLSHTNTRTQSTSVPFTSQSESRASESRSGSGEVENSYSREENASLNRPAWNMEFKDATSAAQAAAESAERASMAARAAAELASRGNMSRQNSTGSNESPTYGKKNERFDKSRGSKMRGEQIVKESVTMANDELKSSRGVKPEVQNLQRDEVMQGISRREAGSTYDDYSSARRLPSRSSSHSSQTYVNDDNFDVSLHKADVKDYGRAQKTMFESEAMGQNRENMKNENVESGRENINVNYSKTASSHYASTFDDDSIWDSDIRKHENGETSMLGAGEGFFGSGHKQPISSDSSSVVFDDYGSDGDEYNSVFGRNKGHLLDSFLPHQGEEPSSFQSNTGPVSPKQHRSGTLAGKSNSELHLFTESYPEKHSETMTKVTLPSQSNDNVPATFDDSDGLSTESEDEVDNSTHKETVRPSSFLHNQRSSTRGSFSEESGHGLNNAFFEEKREVKETMRYSVSPRTSVGYKENRETDSYSADKFWERSASSSLPGSKPSPRYDKAPSNSNDSGRGSGYSSTDEEEPQPLRSSKAQSMKEAEAKEQLGMPSSPLGTEDSEISNEFSYESGQGLNFGRLTGGFKNRGFSRPPYVRSSVVDVSHSSKQTSGDTSFITEKPIVSDLQKPSASYEAPDQESYNQESRLKAYISKPRTSGTSINSHSDKAKGLASYHSVEDTPDMNEREFVSHKDKISEDVDVPAQESIYQRSRRKGYKESSTNSPGTYFDPDSNEQPRYTVDSRRYRGSASTPPKESSDASPDIDKLTASHPNKTLASSEVQNLELYDQKPRMKALKESSTRRPVTYFDSDDREAKLDSHYTAGSRLNTDVKLSRRTRDMPSEAKKSSFSRFTGRSDVLLTSEIESNASQASSPAPEPLSNTTRDAINIQGKGNSKSLRPNPSAEQPSVPPVQISSTCEESPKSSQLNSTERVVSANNGNTKPSSLSGGSASRESSFKNASHTHPKLPDYEVLAAHFHSLRSNQR